MKLVYNPGNTPVVYDNGLMVDPGTWAYVEDTSWLDRALKAGSLVEREVPDEVPADAEPSAVPALQAAVEARQKEEAEARKNSEEQGVRNTDDTSAPRTARTKTK